MTGRLVLLAALLAPGAAAAGETRPAAPAPRHATVGLGLGSLTTRGSVGDKSTTALSLSGDWFPGGGHLGGRLHLDFAFIDEGTSYVNSQRLSGLASALATGRTRVVGPFYAFAGAGAGLAVIRTRHQAVADEMVLWGAHPALTWTLGIELAYQEGFVRAEHLGAWFGGSRDMLYALHIGIQF